MTKTDTELVHLFRALKAPAAARALPKLAERARSEEWSYERFAQALLSTEISSREYRRLSSTLGDALARGPDSVLHARSAWIGEPYAQPRPSSAPTARRTGAYSPPGDPAPCPRLSARRRAHPAANEA
jgi:hypothetical protein